MLTMVGSGTLVESIRAGAGRLKGEIKFMGFLPNRLVLELFKEHQLMLFPSYSEAVGLSVVEAMKAGLVPITSDLRSGIPEIVIDNFTGFRVKIGDEAAFTEKIAYLYHHPEKRHAMRLAAIQLANN